MSPVLNAVGNTLHVHRHVWEPEKVEINRISLVLELPQHGDITAAGQGCLEGEVRAFVGEAADFLECQTARSQGRRFRGKGSEAGRDQVGVDEVRNQNVAWEEITDKGGLARAVRSRDDAQLWT